MKKVFLIGLMLLFTIAFLFAGAPVKASFVDDDVGVSSIMPQDQTDVAVIFVTERLTTYSCDRWQANDVYNYTDFSMTCNPAYVITPTATNEAVYITSGIQSNEKINNDFTRGYRLDIGETSSNTSFNRLI